MAEGQQQDARALLMESLWSDPEIRPEMERLIKKKHPQAPIPGYDARVEADKALVAIRKEREAWEQERATERGQKSLETARRQIQDDPTLRIRDDEIAAVEQLMEDEVIGTHTAAAKLYRASQQVGGGRGSTVMEIPGLQGGGGKEFDWLAPGIKDATVLQQTTRQRAHEILDDFRKGHGERWM